MRKAKVVRLVFALCLGCFLMVVLYFNSTLKPALEPIGEGRSERKSQRSPLQTLYDGDPVSPLQPRQSVHTLTKQPS
ncbi:unnamed protein product [Tetraodon nigroviridis]|uniref:(spotted green pufferfish) hypothetical protein n=1 Tax=Tetraodon nigroviridis TaxID=99883 RepID=Q4SQZ2_TETNG|nr:unnamed protein product [Tetraodon nigroviridis]